MNKELSVHVYLLPSWIKTVILYVCLSCSSSTQRSGPDITTMVGWAWHFIFYFFPFPFQTQREVLVLGTTKPQALVYDILPSITAIFSYTIGSRKLSVNEQFFVGAQTVVSLLQTTQIISDVCFITDHVACASSNKAQIVWIETELFFFFYLGWMCFMFTCVLGH